MTELLTYVVLALAIARLTLIIVKDDIFQPIRHIIFLSSPPENNERLGLYYQSYWRSTPDERRDGMFTVGKNWFERRWTHIEGEPRKAGFIGRLLSCPDCSGVWIAAVVLATFSVWPDQVLLGSYVLAASMVTSLIARRY